MPPVPDNTATLLARLSRREPTAMAEAYDQFGHTIYAVAVRVVRRQEEAEEVVQDTFKALWLHAAELAARDSKLVAWLVTAARRRAIDLLRKRRRRIPTAVDLSEEQALRAETTGEDGATAGDIAEQQERAERVREALATLPADQAEAVRLAFYSGLTHQEVADQLQVPLGTVKSRLRYALTKLQGLMEGLSDE